MKAIVYHRYGPPEVAQLAECPMPVPADSEILVKVFYSTVNRTDSGFRSAAYFVSRFFSGLLRPKLKVLGCEFAGEVVAIGSKVSLFKAGDRVLGFNDKTFGAHAEYMKIAEDEAVCIIPPQISYRNAAAITEGAHYAL